MPTYKVSFEWTAPEDYVDEKEVLDDVAFLVSEYFCPEGERAGQIYDNIRVEKITYKTCDYVEIHKLTKQVEFERCIGKKLSGEKARRLLEMGIYGQDGSECPKELQIYEDVASDGMVFLAICANRYTDSKLIVKKVNIIIRDGTTYTNGSHWTL